MKVTVAITIDRELAEKIENLAKREHRSFSGTVNWIANHYFNANDPKILQKSFVEDLRYEEEQSYEDMLGVVFNIIEDNMEDGNGEKIYRELVKYKRINPKELLLKMVMEGEFRYAENFNRFYINDEQHKLRQKKEYGYGTPPNIPNFRF